ncbi:hypothetical protein [Sphingobacterium sp. SYP-B4668]|uniref:hypothetical protein n=1 Tax=Sphingobacterium sp. SYP-B4668 TaxID=2996035 RepID=UPI0022DE3E18|nr:hypothetical protein [Sphingobacterium sp. SYP-B4668]
MLTVYDILKINLIKSENEKSTSLLDDWADQVVASGNHEFDRGLLGLGWLINFLIHEQIIEGDADEILEDMDDTIYKLTIKEVLNSEVNVHNMLEFVTYYQQRLIYTSSAHFYRRFTHHECMKLLVDKLNAYLIKADLSNQCLSEITDIMQKYSFLLKTCLNEKLLEAVFYKVFEELITYYENDLNEIDQSNVLKLGIAAKQYGNPFWEKCLSDILARHEGFHTNDTFLKRLYNDFPHIDSDYLKLELGEKELFYLITNVVRKC